jgi:dephospho-CoA kinase
MKRKIIIGLVGRPSAGKDTVAAYLVEKYGFTHVSTSDMIRYYIRDNNLGELTRENLQKTGKKMRDDNGSDCLVVLSLQNPAEKLVVSGLRTVAEVKTLKKAGGQVWEVTAPLEIRYQRALGRGRVGEDISLEKFAEIEHKEDSNPDPNFQNVAAVVALADKQIVNGGNINELNKKIEEFLK